MPKATIDPIKVIVTDLDGTVVKPLEDIVSPGIARALIVAKRKGIKISAVTGRPFALALPVLSAMGLDGYNVIDGGATITLGLEGEVVWTSQLDLITVKQIVAKLSPYAHVIYYDDEIGAITDTSLIDAPSIARPSSHVWAAVASDKQEEVLLLLRAIPGIAVHANPEPGGDVTLTGIQATNIEADKEHGVRRLLQYLNVDRNHTLSVGDGDNDLPLFAASSIKVAMGNATDTLKNASDYVVASVDDDGFAEAITIALEA